MISTIYHVVSLLGTAQRLLLGLYMEEMKNRTLHPGEVSGLDFVPPELLAAASLDRERLKMSQSQPDPPVYVFAAPGRTQPQPQPTHDDLPVFLVSDPNDVFAPQPETSRTPAATTRTSTRMSTTRQSTTTRTRPPPATTTARRKLFASTAKTRPSTVVTATSKRPAPTPDVRLKYFGSTPSPKPRTSTKLRTRAPTTSSSTSTTQTQTTITTVTTASPTDQPNSTEKDCGVSGCLGEREEAASQGSRACISDSECESGFKCLAGVCNLDVRCPKHLKFGSGPTSKCAEPRDPFNLPPSPIEKWMTKEVYYDLFPKANIGHGPHKCSPYSYEAFVIAARYFPQFGGESPDNGYDSRQNARRDLAAFFAHAVQETGENDASLYDSLKKKEEADACFYRGGFFNWFEGGPTSSFLSRDAPGYSPQDGNRCIAAGKYCASGAELDYWFPCNRAETDKDGRANITAKSSQARHRRAASKSEFFRGCYYGRGAIQISYNYNYGQFQRWLAEHRIVVDLLSEPNLVMTKKDPPLAILASLWFYMTPQPPKPAMHDIVMGTWEPGEENAAEGYKGAIFGPTSLVINNECGGEDPEDPGGPGESRRIKAFKWFCNYFDVPVEDDRLLTCKGMPKLLDGIRHPLSYQPDWSSTWKAQSCDCAPANYGGMLPYFAPDHYPQRFIDLNGRNRIRCIYSIYDNPSMYGMDNKTSACLNSPIPHALRLQMRDGKDKSP